MAHSIIKGLVQVDRVNDPRPLRVAIKTTASKNPMEMCTHFQLS